MFTIPFLSEFLSFFQKGAQSTLEWGQDMYQEKINDFREMYEKSQHLLETNYTLGLKHIACGNIKDAIFRFKIVLYMEKGHTNAHYQLGRCLTFLQKKEQAKKHLTQVPSSSLHYEEALYLLAVLTPENSPSITSIPSSFIQDYFVHIASDYDTDHCYAGHDALVKLISLHVSLKNTEDAPSILDIGCGTGLLGQALRHHFSSVPLIGVDFVEEMVSYAKAKNIYTDIYVEDVMLFVQKPIKYQGICISRVLCYIKDLRELFTALRSIIHTKGFFAFTFEGEGIHERDTFVALDLESYIHSISFLEQTLKDTQWILVSKEEIFTNDKKGWLYVCVAQE